VDGTNNFWLDLFTWETWNEFLKQRGKISGLPESRWSTVQKVACRDVFLCYLTGLPICQCPRSCGTIIPGQIADLALGCIPGKATRQCADPAHSRNRRAGFRLAKLSFFQASPNSLAWTGQFQGSPNRFKEADGRAILDAFSGDKPRSSCGQSDSAQNPNIPIDGRFKSCLGSNVRAGFASLIVTVRFSTSEGKSSSEPLNHLMLLRLTIGQLGRMPPPLRDRLARAERLGSR
jgi:hypothetical protein